MVMLQSWLERTAMQNSAIRNSCWCDVSTDLLTDENIFTLITLKNSRTQGITNCTKLQQPRRKTAQQNSYPYDQRSDSHWWHQSANHKCWENTFDTCRMSIMETDDDDGVKVIEGCYRHVLLL